ncbi:purine nucleoside phosphorylase [Geomicrobium sp. JCM 19037]|uniref:purine-nucleoside phosphorylase n=1 Tax=Geomicrobium sp. JCM 19037 TaxID=1460634 RepID=UPI00045F229E|nr:purine-nucleoside phosphorylase [Geomicrobium sp. JCM 19037]GAK02346.1 purine nucleoside phosphorylase [Geomicrobium sp. JCM 19037]
MKTTAKTIEYMRSKTDVVPEVAIILGSGLGDLGDKIEADAIIPYEELDGFPRSTVSGHAGRFVIGSLEGKSVIAMQGRFHFYEGYPMSDVVLPVQVMADLGAKTLIVSNAAGGVNTNFSPGDLMLIDDHINHMHSHPLIGPNDDTIGPRFPDMSSAYDRAYKQLAKQEAEKLGLQLKEGVYAGTTGPTYETPAEVRMFRTLGADAVGMSTVPEVIVAVHRNMRVLGISCISNAAAGILDQPLSHEEVIETTNEVKGNFLTLVRAIVRSL